MYKRLDFCLNENCHRWDTSNDAFWVKDCIDLVMTGVVANSIVPVSTQFPIVVAAPIPANPSQMDTSADNQSSVSFDDTLSAFSAYCRTLSTLTIVKSLRTLCHASDSLANDTWVALFPRVWNCLASEEKNELTELLPQFLALDYHADQARARPNNLGAILAGVLQIQPSINIPPVLLLHLAKTHGLWHISADALQTSFVRSPADSSEGRFDSLRDPLADLYTLLGEEGRRY